jgi:hypothetical protein
MAYDFPSSPTEGQIFTPPGGPTYRFKSPAWIVDGSYLPDAPADGTLYGRKNGLWTPDPIQADAGLLDGLTYARRGGLWVVTRQLLLVGRAYYVRPDGNDANTGLADTPAAAFLTLQKAWDTVAALDLGTVNVQIKVADGTYTAGIVMNAMPVGGATIEIVGNLANPGNVHLSINGSAFIIKTLLPCQMFVRGFKATLTGASRSFLVLQAPGTVTVENNIMGGSPGGGYSGFYQSDMAGGKVIIGIGNSIIAGGAAYAVANDGGRVLFYGVNITLTGTPAFSWLFVGAFAMSKLGGSSVTFTGAATGVRYSVMGNSLIDTGSGGLATYYPGSVAGTVEPGSIYA